MTKNLAFGAIIGPIACAAAYLGDHETLGARVFDYVVVGFVCFELGHIFGAIGAHQTMRNHNVSTGHDARNP